MIKQGKDSWDYTLKILHETDAELDEIINDMMQEAHYIADLKNGYAEMSAIEAATEKSW